MKAPKTPVAIFASGRGSNFDAISAAISAGRLDADIRAVVADKADAPVIAKARESGLKALCIEPSKGGPTDARRLEHETRVLAELQPLGVKFLVLAGYMRIMTPHLIEAFRSPRGYARIVNVHPSLLPSFPGVDAYGQAFSYGAKTTGVSVHLVEREVDSGPICAQEAFSIADCKSREEVEKRGLAVEHRLFPETLKWILPEAFSVEKREGGRICVRAD